MFPRPRPNFVDRALREFVRRALTEEFQTADEVIGCPRTLDRDRPGLLAELIAVPVGDDRDVAIRRPGKAQKTLQGYFRNVSSVQLKDVTRPLQPLPYGYNVRTYDYTYAPRGRDRVTTHLVITLKLYGRTEWKLDSIVEKPRPPSGPR